ncbi:MAG: RNA-directed DNA polymerase [Acetobacter sp.]|nr:RNA-directed DNA polymerase [Acetobacter sp.]
MKSSFVKTNKFIPLLTDTLPYEVPVLFSNRGLYETVKNAYNDYYDNIARKKAQGKDCDIPKTIEHFLQNGFMADPALGALRGRIKELFNKPLLPYEYMIVKNQKKQRKISLIHPISQIKICDFYAKHENEILFHTTRNDVSLRHPIKKTSRIFRQHASLINKLTQEEEQQANCDDPHDILEDKNKFELDDIPNNYFVYKKYRLIHKFYDSVEFLELEQHFELCLKFDIKRCFDSIYTHSIAWALKGKEYAKEHQNKDCFEDEIDKLMQSSNWQETHGIPIGSEFSRIFAEIILQKVDQDVEISLEDSKKIKNGVDFKICRYVDDFFVFVNKKEIGEEIIKKYEEKLLEYKLFPNQDKYEVLFRPFVTKTTAAKQRILPKIKETMRRFHYIEEQGIRLNADNLFANISNCHGLVKSLIEEIRATVHDAGIEMLDISNLVLAQIKRELVKILNIILSLKEPTNEVLMRIITGSKKYLNDILDLSFYMFHLSSRSNTTYGICKICFEILEILKQINDNKLNNEIKQKIYSQFLLFFENKATINAPIIEFLDVIWVINELGDKYKIPKNRLIDIISQDQKELGYFELMVILSYIKKEGVYNEIHNEILNKIKYKMSDGRDIFDRAETFMMFFDIIKCPYIENNYKKQILSMANLNKNKNKIIDFIENRKWFFGWEEELTLKKLFEIKELQNVY